MKNSTQTPKQIGDEIILIHNQMCLGTRSGEYGTPKQMKQYKTFKRLIAELVKLAEQSKEGEE